MERRFIVIAAALAAALFISGAIGIVLLQQPEDNDANGGGQDTITTPPPTTSDSGNSDTTPTQTSDSSPSESSKANDNSPLPTPPSTITPVPDSTKNEPVVHTELASNMYFGPTQGQTPSPLFSEPAQGQISTWVARQADAAHIGVMVYFVGLSNADVYVNATTSNGQLQWINLYNDGGNGCYGMLMDDPSAINNGMGWTWMYTGSGSTEYHNISITVTIYKLGPFQLKTYAYDQDTGKLVSDTQSYSLSCYGTGGKYHDHPYMFDNAVEGGAYGFTPGEKYHFNFTDTSLTTRYEGMVRSVLTLPYVQNMWMVNDDGSLTLMQKNADNSYSWTWYHHAGLSSHTTHMIIQLGEAGAGPYPYSSGDYLTVDDRTGLSMSHVNGMSHSGAQIYLQSA